MSSRRAPRPRRIRPTTVALGLGGVLVVLAVLAWPFLSAPEHAEAARADMENARTALIEGDDEAAIAAVKSAREHTDAVQDAVQGIGGDVWSWVPVAAGPVRDVRRLGNALDDLVSVAELGVDVWPQLSGEEATLYDEGDIDLPTLAAVTDDFEDATLRLAAARSELEEISDRRLLGGAMLSDARDQALAEVGPMADGAEALRPILDVLPEVLGATDGRKYVLAILNPAELLYSGGTPQTFSTIGFDQGDLTMGPTLDLSTNDSEFFEERYWRKVKGNPFHRGRLRTGTATTAPDWRVSGEELANAWRSTRGRRMAGVIAIDVVALSELVALTGPVDVPGLGTLTEETMVETLIGSYDKYPDVEERKRTNRSLGPIFAERLFSGDPVDTMRVLGKAAKQRRFALFFREEVEQQAFDDIGLTGRLGSAERDYLGVFTRSRVGAKSDYWQQRSVRSDVKVRPDGSARVRLQIDIHNDSPPYVQPGSDPREGYWTRWSFQSVMAMLPSEAHVRKRSVDGKTVPRVQGRFYDHIYSRYSIDFAPQARHTFVVDYDVPRVAEVAEDGTLHYGLALDPQGLVRQQAVDVRVRFPRGHEVSDLPEEWKSPRSNIATFRTPGLTESQSFEVVATP